jgi:hypothetical protein
VVRDPVVTYFHRPARSSRPSPRTAVAAPASNPSFDPTGVRRVAAAALRSGALTLGVVASVAAVAAGIRGVATWYDATRLQPERPAVLAEAAFAAAAAPVPDGIAVADLGPVPMTAVAGGLSVDSSNAGAPTPGQALQPEVPLAVVPPLPNVKPVIPPIPKLRPIVPDAVRTASAAAQGPATSNDPAPPNAETALAVPQPNTVDQSEGAKVALVPPAPVPGLSLPGVNAPPVTDIKSDGDRTGSAAGRERRADASPAAGAWPGTSVPVVATWPQPPGGVTAAAVQQPGTRPASGVPLPPALPPAIIAGAPAVDPVGGQLLFVLPDGVVVVPARVVVVPPAQIRGPGTRLVAVPTRPRLRLDPDARG